MEMEESTNNNNNNNNIGHNNNIGPNNNNNNIGNNSNNNNNYELKIANAKLEMIAALKAIIKKYDIQNHIKKEFWVSLFI